MKKIAFILIIVSLFSTQSCKNNDCEDIQCFTPPNAFLFELVDKTSKENLFTNGTYNKTEIQLINTADNSLIEYTFIDENNYNIIQLNSIGWKTETIEYVLKINDDEIFKLYVDASRLYENCCSFTKFNEIKIENAEYQYNNQSDIYQILID